MAGITLSELLKKMIEMGGSDLHITTNSAPRVRVHGRLRPLDMPPLTAADTKSLAYSVLTDAQKHRFEENLELDFSFGLKNLARFRGNVFNQRGAVGAVFRTIPWEIKGFDALGLPAVVKRPLRQAARPGSGHRANRFRQVHHPGGHARQDQRRTRRAHDHHRGPHRVPPQPQEVPGEPARSPRRHALLRQFAARRACAKTPTSCSSAKCATWKPSNPPCASRKPAT